MVKRWAMIMALMTPLFLPASAWAGSDEDAKAVRAAVDQWFVVLNAMLNGDPGPFAALYSHADDIFYMGAEGTYRRGWEAAYADWKAQAAKGTGGKVEGGDIHIVVDGDTAIAAHWTVGTVKQADGKIAEVNARETSIFRKEQGEWRMIGHHADVVPPWAKKFD